MSIAKQSTTLFICQLLTFSINMITDILLSRTIGPEGRGIYATIITSELLVIGLLIFGMGYAPTYFLAKKIASLKEIHTVVVVSVILISLLGVILYFTNKYLLGYNFNNTIKRYVVFIVLLMPLGFYKQCWNSIMIGLNKVIEMGKAYVLFGILNLASMAIILLGLKYGIKGALISVLISDTIVVTIMLQRIFRMGGLSFVLRRKLFKEMAIFGGVNHIGNIAVSLYQRMVIFFLGVFSGMTQVGFYTLGMNIAEKQLAALSPIYTASNYRIIGDEIKTAELLLAKVIRYSSTLLLLACLMIVPTSGFIIRLLYGKAFEPANIPLMFLMPGVAIHGISCFFSLYFSGQLGKPIITMKISIACFLVSLPITWFLTSKYHLYGASVGTLFIYMVAALPLVYLFVRKSHISPLAMCFVSWKDIKEIFTTYHLKIHGIKRFRD